MPDDTKLPLIDEQRVTGVFTSLEGMEVHLDPDPLVYGPRRLNSKVAKARSMLTRCERIFLQTSHDLQIYKTYHRIAQLDFDLQMQDLIANDPEVRAGSNVRDRDAIATMKLRGDRENLMKMEVAIGDLEMVMTVIKAKRADLRDIQGRIRDQIKLCQEEIGLGGHWGARPGPGEDAPDLDNAPQTDPRALASIQELVQDAGADEVDEVHLAEGDASWMDGEHNDADVDEVLAAVAEAESEAEEETSPVKGLMDDTIMVDDKASFEANATPVEDAWGRKEFYEFPKLGYCAVCGEPSYETPSGSLCKNSHGGADWTVDPPEEPEPTPEPTPEPEPDLDPEAEAPKDDGVDMDELFKDGGTGSQEDPIPPVESDTEVDDIFDKIDATPPPSKAKEAAPSADEDLDLDNLIDMFGEDS